MQGIYSGKCSTAAEGKLSGYLAGKVWHSALDADLKPLAANLADIADDDGSSIYPSVAFVAWRLGRVESCVRDGMRKLREAGVLIVVEQGGGRSKPTEYWMDENALPHRPKWISKPSDNRMVSREIPSGLPPKPSDLGVETLRCSGEDPSVPVIDPSEEARTANLSTANPEWEAFQEREKLRKDREAEKQARKGGRNRSPLQFRNPTTVKGGTYGTRQSSEERRIAKQQRIREACERAQEKLAAGTL